MFVAKLQVTTYRCRPLWVGLDVPQVLLDVPQSAGAGLQLVDLVVRQGHVDHAGHASTVQHAGQTQVDLVTDPVHALRETEVSKHCFLSPFIF